MTTPGDSTERADQIRRTRSVRRGVVVAGATGALGAAIAIGATIQATGTADSGTTDDSQALNGTDDTFAAPDDQGSDQSPQAGRLAGPSSNGPAQGRSGGS